MYSDIKYFRGLNSLRFFAAYLVLLHHAEQIRMKYGLFNWKEFSFFNNGGPAVTFFFVLSGFLISYLLLRERKETGNISVRKFYIRRILRIWPLYFLLVLLGTIVVPAALQLLHFSYEMPYRFGEVVWYFLFFAPFMVNIIYGHHLLEPLWSIGVEELFYLMWAPLFVFLKRHILKIIIGVILLKIALFVLFHFVCAGSMAAKVAGMLKFEAMAVGGLAAYWIFHRKRTIAGNVWFSVPVQWVLLSFILLKLAAYTYLREHSLLFDWLFSSFLFSDMLSYVLFAWLIVNISLNEKSIIRLDGRILNFLGEISYGIYMYHMLVIFGLVLVLGKVLNNLDPWLSSGVFYILLTGGVVGVSYISKVFFEGRFLRLKVKFES